MLPWMLSTMDALDCDYGSGLEDDFNFVHAQIVGAASPAQASSPNTGPGDCPVTSGWRQRSVCGLRKSGC